MEPIGGNDWSAVAAKFGEYSVIHHRPHRDVESVKMKFDRLASTKKPTGDPSCPPNVRRAKLIARSILGKVNAISMGDESSSGSDGEITDLVGDSSPADETGGGGGSHGNTAVLGGRKGRRKPGGAGVKVHGGDDMVQFVGDMAASVSSLVDAVRHTPTVDHLTHGGMNMQASIREAVKEEVKQELSHTNESIEELKALVKASLARVSAP